MIPRNIRNTSLRIIIAVRLNGSLSLATRGLHHSEHGRRMVERDLARALDAARRLPDNPGNRVIRASIVACQVALGVAQ